MPERPSYLAASRRLALDPADLAARAAWLDLGVWATRPLPTDRAGLLITAAGVRLEVPGGGTGAWPAGLVDRRTERGPDDTLIRALEPRPGERVLDGTLGLGHDALLLARHQVRVLALERDPALLFYAAQGLRAYDPEAARRIAFRCVDHRDFLARQAPDAFDAVYLDPMFPPGRHGRGPTLEALRRCAVPDPVEAPTLQRAFTTARRVLVLRLPPGADAPAVPGLPPARRVESRRAAFAVWPR